MNEHGSQAVLRTISSILLQVQSCLSNHLCTETATLRRSVQDADHAYGQVMQWKWILATKLNIGLFGIAKKWNGGGLECRWAWIRTRWFGHIMIQVIANILEHCLCRLWSDRATNAWFSRSRNGWEKYKHSRLTVRFGYGVWKILQIIVIKFWSSVFAFNPSQDVVLLLSLTSPLASLEKRADRSNSSICLQLLRKLFVIPIRFLRSFSTIAPSVSSLSEHPTITTTIFVSYFVFKFRRFLTPSSTEAYLHHRYKLFECRCWKLIRC